MYTKDLARLLQLLSVSGQSGLLRLEPLLSDGDREPWHAHLILVEGEVITCQVLSKVDGQELVSGSPALEWLKGLGVLSWSLEGLPDPGMKPPRTPPSFPGDLQNPLKMRATSSSPVPGSELGPDINSPPMMSPGLGSNTGSSPAHPYELDTNIDKQAPSMLPPEQLRQSAVVIPRRTASGERATVSSSWPRDYRLVFVLVDGHRTLEEIAALLHKPLHVVAQVLRDLQSSGFIE